MTLPHHVSAKVLQEMSPPTVRIHTDADVEAWQNTAGYQLYGTFLRRLNDSVAGWNLPLQDTVTDSEVGRMLYSYSPL
jgi:serine/threonine-protein phosphatase 2A activator